MFELPKINKKGQAGGAGLVQYFVGLMVVTIIAVSATIPTVQSAISSGNFSGTTTGTILDLIPLMIAVSVLTLTISPPT